MIPRPNKSSSRFEVLWMQKSSSRWAWVESENAGMREYASTLSQNSVQRRGLQSSRHYGYQPKGRTVSIFRYWTLPFYMIISHPDVLSSLSHAIYPFLFGPGSRRGLGVFHSTATALSGMIMGHSPNNDEVSTIAISSSLAVLDRLIEINQSA
ncbi:hypothetical protein BKA65DRAFT_521483 [Rhexocercosporidium sp. MPI-PUGE-AT-0058]|nr:hypothetical protein BKA65DRAFT_521483 [Rhexocercosporidium sp. MPI-PUGE-AT-0058]